MENLTKGFACLDNDDTRDCFYIPAYCDVSNSWNGWYKPYIHHLFIKDLIEALNFGDTSYEFEGDSIRIKYEDEYNILISPTIIEGETYYYLGDEGICFDWEAPDKIDLRPQGVVADIDGLVYDNDEIDRRDQLKVGDLVYVNEYGFKGWQVYVESRRTGHIHGIDTERIVLI